MKKENLQVLHSFLSPLEYTAILSDTRETIKDDSFLDFLLHQNIILKIDENSHLLDIDILNFIMKRLDCRGKILDIDPKKLHKKVLSAVRKEKIKKEEVIAFIIKNIKKKLDKDYMICKLERNEDDACYIGVLKKKEFKKVRKLDFTYGEFIKYGKNKDESEEFTE